MRKYILLSLLFITLLLTYYSAQGQHWQMTEKLGSIDQQAADNLGISVAISDSTMVAGAWCDDGQQQGSEAVNCSGAAYIYRLLPNGRWTEVQKLVSPNKEPLGYFGFRVAIKSHFIIIGAFNEDRDGFGNAGRVYVYHKQDNNVWQLVDTLTSPDAANADYFGYDLALTDDYALIGAYNHDYDENGNNFIEDAGAVYIYKRTINNHWNLVNKLTAFDRAAGDNFGKYLDIDPNGLVVGAFRKNGDMYQLTTGAAYGLVCSVSAPCDFENVTSSDLRSILPNDQDALERFGWDVAISGNYVVAGKSSESNQPNGHIASNTGAAYFFHWENNDWSQTQKVYASDYQVNAFFGRCIGMNDNICVIGAGTEPKDASGSNPIAGAGAAYIFELQSDGRWEEVEKIAGTERNFNDLFAEDAVAIDGQHIAIGAWRADTIQSDHVNDGGVVYIFERDEAYSKTKRQLPQHPNTFLINNPSHGELVLSTTPGHLFNGQFSLFDINGHQVDQQYIEFSSMWRQRFECPAGLYFVHLQSDGFEPLVLTWIKL